MPGFSQTWFYQSSPRHVGSPGRLIIWRLFKKIFHKTFSSKNWAGKTLWGRMLELKIIFWRIFFRVWTPDFTSSIYPITPVTSYASYSVAPRAASRLACTSLAGPGSFGLLHIVQLKMFLFWLFGRKCCLFLQGEWIEFMRTFKCFGVENIPTHLLLPNTCAKSYSPEDKDHVPSKLRNTLRFTVHVCHPKYRYLIAVLVHYLQSFCHSCSPLTLLKTPIWLNLSPHYFMS